MGKVTLLYGNYSTKNFFFYGVYLLKLFSIETNCTKKTLCLVCIYWYFFRYFKLYYYYLLIEVIEIYFAIASTKKNILELILLQRKTFNYTFFVIVLQNFKFYYYLLNYGWLENIGVKINSIEQIILRRKTHF